MRIRLISPPILATLLGLAGGTSAHVGDEIYFFYELRDEDLERIDLTDGSVEDWLDDLISEVVPVWRTGSRGAGPPLRVPVRLTVPPPGRVPARGSAAGNAGNVRAPWSLLPGTDHPQHGPSRGGRTLIERPIRWP